MKNILVLSIVLSLCMIGCKEEKKTEAAPMVSNQMKEVMAIHDEVMPKMGKVGRLVGKLKPMVDTTAQGKRYEKAMKDLQNANTSMMKWMQDFGDQFDSDEIMNGKELSEQKKLLLNVEEENIKVVKQQIESSITNAEALLGEK
ncbi:hypothetical protein [Maribacter sp. 2307UL18-2]|uniref:hypothetical protein n=1 Tax=Maribacter sp. 2307UL18-2 TaxID=3386274 RepID=UPI0039BCB98D